MAKVISKKQQKMYDALLCYSEVIGYRLHVRRVPKHLYKKI